MKTELLYLEDEEYNSLVSSWEKYAEVTVSDLMIRYKATDVDAIEIYAKENELLNLTQYYYFDESMNMLSDYILTQDDFKDVFTGSDLQSAVDLFMENVMASIFLGDTCFIISEPDLGISWFRTNHHGDYLYWNMDDLWAYWKSLNEENYFNR